MVIFLYNLYIFVWIQHFWDPLLNQLISQPSYNEPSYKESRVYIQNFSFHRGKVLSGFILLSFAMSQCHFLYVHFIQIRFVHLFKLNVLNKCQAVFTVEIKKKIEMIHFYPFQTKIW